MSVTTYTVRPGNTLFAIAQFFGTTVNALQELNGINDPNSIFVGQVLRIPEFGMTTPSFYVVRPGDTLWSIAKRYGISTNSILEYNNLDDPNTIYPGQFLQMPV